MAKANLAIPGDLIDRAFLPTVYLDDIAAMPTERAMHFFGWTNLPGPAISGTERIIQIRFLMLPSSAHMFYRRLGSALSAAQTAAWARSLAGIPGGSNV